MGTRGLYGAVIDGEMKLLQYGQWDAYPTGQGKAALEFTRSLVADDLENKFADRLRALRDCTETDRDDVYLKADVHARNGWITMDEGDRIKAAAPQLSRDTCADIYRLVLTTDVGFVQREPDFATDGLFCEWSYVVDLDRRELRVYAGAWSGAPLTESEEGGLVEAYSFDNLPTDSEFFATLEPDDD